MVGSTVCSLRFILVDSKWCAISYFRVAEGQGNAEAERVSVGRRVWGYWRCRAGLRAVQPVVLSEGAFFDCPFLAYLVRNR